MFFDNWVRHKGFPCDIVSDRSLVFQTTFWQPVMCKTRVNLTMTTAWHPEGDGQTERINSILNMYMRSFCEGDQLDWPILLPVAKLCYNTTQMVSHEKTPFYLYYVQEATHAIDLSSGRSQWYRDQERLSRYFSQDAVQWVEWCNVILRNTRLKLAKAQDRYANVVNKKRQNERFVIGEKVWLDSRNLGLLIELSSKWSVRWIGPFPVKKMIH